MELNLVAASESGRNPFHANEVIHCLSENRIRVTDFRTLLPNLEDVFLKLTGEPLGAFGSILFPARLLAKLDVS